jgi:hypothetical protein
VCVLLTPVRVLQVFRDAFRGLSERFLVGDVRARDRGFDLELALEAIDARLELIFILRAEPCRPLAPRLGRQARIAAAQRCQPARELLSVGVRLRLDAEPEENHR